MAHGTQADLVDELRNDRPSNHNSNTVRDMMNMLLRILALVLVVGASARERRRIWTHHHHHGHQLLLSVSSSSPSSSRSALARIKNQGSLSDMVGLDRRLAKSVSIVDGLRGGASVADSATSQSSGVQSLVQSLLATSERISPSMAKLLRSLIGMLEKMLGLELLPKTRVKLSRKKLTRKKHTSRKQSTVDEPSDSPKRSRKVKTKADTASTGSTSKSSPDSIPAKPAAAVPSRRKSSGQTQKAPPATSIKKSSAQQHLLTSIKSSSPNYRIQRELKQFILDPPPNLSVKVGKNIRIWIVTIVGAAGSVYEGETFQLRIQFPPQYPTVPPSVYFLPPHIPLHEHVYTNGDICLSLLGKDWRPTMTAQSIAVSIQSILNNSMRKELPMDNAQHAHNKPGQFQKDWVYHDDNC